MADTITLAHSFKTKVCVSFLDHPDFRLARYHDISLEGFRCYSTNPFKKEEKYRVEINLKMMSGGMIDDLEPHIAVAELIGSDVVDGQTLFQFRFVEFTKNCFDDLVKAMKYLEKKESIIAFAAMQEDGLKNLDQGTISDIVKDVSEKIKKGQIALPVLPKVMQDVEEVLKTPNSSVEDMAKVIEKDSVISVKLISTANTPYYRGRSPIYTVKETIPRLGFEETRNMVLTIVNKSLYSTMNKQFKQLLEKLWQHSLASAFSAKAIAEKIGLQNPESIFTIGLVHDVGRTLLLRLISGILPFDKSVPLNDLITSIDDHDTALSKIILTHWKFSEDFINAVVQHKDSTFDPQTEKTILVLNIADNLMRSIGYDIEDSDVDMSKLQSVSLLNIDPDTLNEISENVKETMKDSANSF